MQPGTEFELEPQAIAPEDRTFSEPDAPTGMRHESKNCMKGFFKWTAIVAGAGVGVVFAVRGIQAGRRRVKHALGEAEAIANQTRETLAQTQTALRHAREAI